jgi:hypothetical protein
LLALAVGVCVCLLLSGDALRLAAWLAVAGLGALPPLVLGLSSRSLTADGVALGRREHAGLLLLVVLVGCAVVAALAAERLLVAERTFTLSPAHRRRLRQGLAVIAGGAVIAAALALALSSRGLSGSVGHAWNSFTTTRAISVSNPDRLLSADSANRWVWWREAAGAFSDRPLTGWGAGSFGRVHLLYRQDMLPVSHAHSAPLEWLAETGLPGALLAIGAWLLLLATGVAAARSRLIPGPRVLKAASMAAVLAYAVHALYDWDWEMPGITLPALILLGVLCGSAGRRVAGGSRPAAGSPAETGPALRLLALLALSAGLCTLALSSVLPSVAAGRASAAFVAASAGRLGQAHADAVAAAALDPLSDAGPEAEATVALHRGDEPLTRAYVLQAIARDPTDDAAWQQLAVVDFELGRWREDLRAAQRVLELDPFSLTARRVALTTVQQVELRISPPLASATAIPTP